MSGDLYERVAEIAETMRRARDRDVAAHVLIGAGCSKSAGIPVASELIKEARRKYHARCRDLPADAKNLYGLCMSRLTANERRALINPHIDGARMNWAHIALAQMIKKGFVSRILSVNFDPLVSRACSLVGLHPAVYDFGAAPFEDLSRIVTLAVLYLHGQSYGFVVLNTDSETERHAQKLAPVLRDTLNRAPLLAIGYSGGADGIFSTIQQEYAQREAFYWVDKNACPLEAEGFFKKERHVHCRYISDADADSFLLLLARELNSWPPTVFEKPIDHLLDLIEPIIPFPVGDDHVDLLAEARRNLSRLRQEEARKPKKISLQTMRLIGSSADVAKLAPKTLVTEQKLKKQDRVILASALFDEARKLHGQVENASRSKKITLLRDVNNKLRESIRLQPDFEAAKVSLARTQSELGNRTRGKESLESLRDARKIFAKTAAKSHPGTLNELGLVLLRLGMRTPGRNGIKLLERSIFNFERSSKLDRKSPSALHNSGVAYINIARRNSDKRAIKFLEAARTKFEAAISINPRFPATRTAATLATIELGCRAAGHRATILLKQASKQLSQLSNRSADSAIEFAQWGRALAELERRMPATSPKGREKLRDESEEKFQIAEKTDPGLVAAQRARIAANEGNEAECQQHIERMVGDKFYPYATALLHETPFDQYRRQKWFRKFVIELEV